MGVVASFPLPGGRSFLVVEGDLLAEPVDAIVNAANDMLAHGGGVAAAISQAAGAELDEDGRAQVKANGPFPVGSAAVTTAGDLPFEGVIHAIGPRNGEGAEETKLARAIESALDEACHRSWKSVSFPAVSSGIFGVPLETCARAYVRGVRSHFENDPDSSLEEVRACLLPGSPLVGLLKKEMRSTE